MSGTTWNRSACAQFGRDYAAFSYTLFKAMADGQTSFVQAFSEADYYVEEEDFACSIIESPNPWNQVGQDPKYVDNGDTNGGYDYNNLLDNGNGILGSVTGL